MSESEFVSLWKKYEPFIQAIVELFHPFAEAAVHDLEKGTIACLYHNISKRKEGDISPLKELKVETKDFPDYFPPYYKENWDGSLLKCTSITLRNKKGTPIGLICINVDVSFYKEASRLIDVFLKTKDEGENPIEIFGSQFENQANALIQQYLDEKSLSLQHLTRDNKKELIQALYQKGLFNFKNAAPFIAKKLKMSRASVYNYIKQIT